MLCVVDNDEAKIITKLLKIKGYINLNCDNINWRLEDALKHAGNNFEAWMIKLSEDALFKAPKDDIDMCEQICDEELGRLNDSAREFIVNAVFSELMNSSRLNTTFQQQVKEKLDIK